MDMMQKIAPQDSPKKRLEGWLIHNGAVRTTSMEAVDHCLLAAAQGLGVGLHLLPNNRILPMIDQNGQRQLHLLDKLPPPDFVLFWDKDVALAQHLSDMGYRLYNSPQSIALCDDKIRTHQALAGQGIPMPKTLYGPKVFVSQALADEYYDAVERLLGYPLVFKEAFGSFGMQVYLVENRHDLKTLVKQVESRPFLLQAYIAASAGRDIRVNLIGGEVVGAIERSNANGDFRSNVALGGSVRPVALMPEQQTLAERVCAILGLSFCGVDMLTDQQGTTLLCEVNSNVNFTGFQEATSIDFSRLLLSYVLRDITSRP